MKKKHTSLAFNVNMLIIAITVTIAVALVVIIERSVRISILDPYSQRMDEIMIDTDEISRFMEHFMPCFGTEDLAKAKENADIGEDHLIDFLSEKPSFTEKNEGFSRANMFLDWVALDIILNDAIDSIDLDEACAEVVKDGVVYRISHCARRTKKYSSNADFGLEKQYIEIPPEDCAETDLVRIGKSYHLIRCIRFSLREGEGRIWLSYDLTEVQNEHRILILNCIGYILLLTVIATLISMFLLQSNVTSPIRMLAESAMKFEADEDGTYSADKINHVEVRFGNELDDLSREITSMQTRIVENAENLARMTNEKQRIVTELNMAAKIQSSMLPSTFPAFPDRKEFDLFASMTPARNVGGDFYDFFLIDDDHLALVIADVSGKGVPGALFMMVSKLILENSAGIVKSPAEILRAMNDTVCAHNKMEMFVTVWFGILEISTGTVTTANAGHEYPVVFRKDSGSFRFLKDPHGFVIGGMEGLRYKDFSFSLKPGDKLFVFTDGVTEATSSDMELFGNDRLIQALNENAAGSPESILNGVKNAVDAFVGDAEQFDDLTMLCLEYRG